VPCDDFSEISTDSVLLLLVSFYRKINYRDYWVDASDWNTMG
jgi:hypothetical protein